MEDITLQSHLSDSPVWFFCLSCCLDYVFIILLLFKNFILFLFLIFLFLLYFTSQYCICFAIHWHVSTTGVHEFPNMNPPSHLPPHIISLDHPHAPAPSILYPASNIDWQFVSYIIVYMFQCHSPNSCHPLPLPQSPKVRSSFWFGNHFKLHKVSRVVQRTSEYICV